MGTLTIDAPSGTVTDTPDSVDVEYVRDVDDALGALEFVEVELWSPDDWQNLGFPQMRWQHRARVDGDSFSMAFSRFLRNDIYALRARVRDRRGTWSDWTAPDQPFTIDSFDPVEFTWDPGATLFTVAAASPVLSDLKPNQGDTIVLEALAGLRFSAAYSDAVDSPCSALQVQVTAQQASEDWEGADWTEPTLAADQSLPPHEQNLGRVVARYAGRTLPGGAVYLWRMRAQNAFGSWSEWLGGQFEVEARDTAIPGPVETVTDQWSQLWETGVIAKPVGLWYDPADAANIRVIDAKTRNLATIRQSDREVIQSDYLGAVVTYAAGLSGDPADPDVFWLLDAPWTQGAGGSAHVKQIDRTTFAVLLDYNVGTAHYSALKVSANWFYLTNLVTGEIERYNKATGALHSAWGVTYDSVEQTKPTGIMVDGTDLWYFFYNDGSTKRFLKATEANPDTIIDVTFTEGLAIIGGEMDTTTHTEMFGDSDLLSKVWKFSLTVTTYSNGGQAGRPLPALTTLGDA